MQIVRRHLSLASWLAWLALAALSFAPTASRATAPGTPLWGDVCTTAGKTAPSSDHLGHCPLCQGPQDALGGSVTDNTAPRRDPGSVPVLALAPAPSGAPARWGVLARAPPVER